jgi:hypothetical protein
MYRVLLFIGVLTASLAFTAQNAFASAIAVDADGHATPGNCASHSLAYSTIQDAVDYATTNSLAVTIKVCPGTYPEQVTVASTGIKLLANGPRAQVVITSPATVTSPNALVLFDGGATGDAITGFTISGPLPDNIFCGTDAWGVKVQGGATATIANNHITEIRSADPGLRGCQQGLAIGVGRQATGQIGHATIKNNVIDKFQKGGIYVDGAGSKATITGNTVTGIGPTADIAANGIQISRNAIGHVNANTVTANSYTGTSASSSGILLFEANGSTVVNGATATANDVNVWLSDIVGTTVKFSTANDGQWGFTADTDVANAKFLNNTASGNTTADCEDDSTGSSTAGTANIWRDDTGAISVPAGICTGPATRAAGAHGAAPHTSPAR